MKTLSELLAIPHDRLTGHEFSEAFRLMGERFAEHDRRVTELLESNNFLLERARKAERERDVMQSTLLAAVKLIGKLAAQLPESRP